MSEEPGGGNVIQRPLLEASAASVGMIAFALFLRPPLPWLLLAPAGFILTIAALIYSSQSGESPRELLGFTALSQKVFIWTVIGIPIGAGLAILFRSVSDQTLLPGAVERFIIVAAVIGAVEELLYRGYVQGRLKDLGMLPAVLLAAVAHTAYKTALFTFPPGDVQMNLGAMALWTFLVGSAFGLTRHFSGSVLPALSAHVLFDILVYGDLVQAPWWVWG